MDNNRPATHTYHVTALQMTIYFNKEGDHDHNGLLFTLTENVPLLKHIRALAAGENPGAPAPELVQRAKNLGVPLPRSTTEARKPHPLVRPLVLRGNVGGAVEVVLENQIRDRWIGPHLVADGYDVKGNDGSHAGQNPHSLVKPGGSRIYTWQCSQEGVFPFHDGGNYSGGEDGTNVHGLFGALIVEPPNAIWRDPVTGRTSREAEMDGLYLDVIPSGEVPPPDIPEPTTTLKDHEWGAPKPYPNFDDEAHREFVIFFHDEPEFLPPHVEPPKNPCVTAGDGGHGAGGGHGSGGHGDLLPIMPVSYRAEPMINREHELFRLLKNNPHHFGDRPVLNEEQHHSSWMFGDPATPILKAYIGDPVRIRFVHAGVKETHVFHLHLYEWHAVPEDPNSPRIDAISVSPQTAHTIEPVWGAGNRHQVAGDVIWHCHLYPHFHEGMWGMFRTFETLQTGAVGAGLQSDASVYDGRRIGQYPDGTLIECLRPLPGRPLPPKPIPTHPGYPLYIPGAMQQKSPLPPWPATAGSLPDDYDYRPSPTDLEQNAFNGQPVPGELFTRNPLRSQQTAQWNGEPDNPADPTSSHDFGPNGGEREVHHDVVVEKQRIDYNGHGWHDKDGHLYYLEDEGNPDTRKNPDGSPRTKEPLFFRALHGQILNLTLHNGTPPVIKETEFDPPFPPCAALPWQGECAMHVHMVKFDPICADGASVGWNYISGPVHGKKMVYRWWLDQEFGTIFFHDHLFANYRQKHGLFGALLVEPIGAEFFDPFSGDKIVSGLQARVRIPGSVEEKVPLYSAMAGSSAPTNWFREFCIGIGDFIPMWDKDDRPLNPPDHPGGHGDQGVMALNYRSDPIHERLRDPTDPDGRRRVDPARWFSSLHPYNRDPFTTRFATFENDPIWFRAVQGSHEEQHSFQVHGMRWRRFRVNTGSPIRNQQTFGIAEAFTFINHEAYGPGDYLYKLSGADDLWLGCWGLIRAFRRAAANSETGGLLPLADGTPATSGGGIPAEVPATDDEPAPETALPAGAKFRHFRVIAERKKITYREPDLVDPFGLVYRLEAITDQDGVHYPVQASDSLEPMVLRCREDEWVKVTLVNKLPNGVTLRPEPFAPQVPVEEVNPFSFRPERPVSSQVSLHADLVTYDVTQDDGATVGRNPRQTVKPGEERTYAWNPARPRRRGDEPEPNAGEPLGPVLLQDMADFRNHRHHGLIGALVIEKTDATPYAAAKDEATASAGAPEAWNGARATVVRTGALPPEAERFEEVVLLLQDGLRLFLRGNIHLPIPDEAPAHGEEAVDHEDQGQKAFNYRSEPVGPSADPGFDSSGSNPPGDWLANPNPATPVWRVPAGQRVRFHFVGASDKPRNHSFTIHGVTWPEWRFKSKKVLPRVASESAITCGTGRTFEFTPQNPGDHAFRSGVLKWAVPQGLWGILRVVETGGKEGVTSSQDARNAATRSSRSYLGVAALTGAVVGLAVLLRNRRPKNAS